MFYSAGHKRIVALILGLSVSVSTGLFAQMDMLPQIFRDLPPELQHGLPQEMTHREYRQLNRNVDFFTMFMSMFVPGYGMFQVERPGLGWTVAGVRVAGAGLMTAAVVRQWNDFRDLADLSDVPDIRYQRFVENAFLFGGGIFVNGMGWALDVIGAYHIAKSEKDFVTYQYGVRETVSGNHPDSAEDRAIEYIRLLVLQDEPGERLVRDELSAELDRYVRQFPSGEYRAEVEYYGGSLALGEGRDVDALLQFTRQFILFPEPRFSASSRRNAIRIVQANRHRWANDWELLISMMEAPASSGDRVEAYLTAFGQLEASEFRRLFISEALDLAYREPDAPYADRALYEAAVQLERLERFEQAIQAHSVLSGVYPDSDLWAESVLRIAQLLDTELNESRFARRYYIRLIDRFPDGSEASVARRALDAL